MFRTRVLASFGAVAVAALLGGAYFIHAPASTYHATLDEYCFRCHSSTSPRAELNLRDLDLTNFEKNGAVWEKLLHKLRNHEMPPAGRWRPDEGTIKSFVNYIDEGRDHLADTKPNPGRPTLHRLNRVEYGNVVHDLLAMDVDVTDLLPADDIGYGFDNIGDVLNVSPLLLERYLSAAGKISQLAVGDKALPVSYQTYDIPHELVQSDRMSGDLPVGSRGGFSVTHRFPVDGEYEISVALQRGRYNEVLGLDREHKLDLRLDGKRLELFSVEPLVDKKVDKSPSGQAYGGGQYGSGHDPDANFKIRLPVTAGLHTLVATFLKDTVQREPGDLTEKAAVDFDTSFFEGVGGITVAGPYNVQGLGTTASRKKIFLCHPNTPAQEQPCAEKILSNLAHHAYRRPVSADDMHSLLALYQKGTQNGGFEAGIKLALEKILVSPEFLFRTEFDPPNAAPGSVYRISDVELASRLSFFLWSRGPDDALLAIAEKGKLSDPAVLDAQVRRMIADPRSKSLVTNFAGQWLYLRNIDRIRPDPDAFPSFDENLRRAMATETEMLIESTLRADRSVADLLSTNYTFVNQRLAEHYGIKGIYGPEFRRVAITDPNRMGLLGQASILAVTSYPNRTAPTIRGKWVLEQFLGMPPAPPPPNVPALKDDATTIRLSMRQRMEQHRADPNCAVCHHVMDPIGFSLENFDGVGKWRDSYGPDSGKIDSTGALPDGTQFNGPAGLRKILLGKKEQFVETFTGQFLTYALGRGVEEYDRPVIRKIVRASAADDYRWSSIILGIVKSTPFQMRRVNDGALMRQASLSSSQERQR